MHLKSPYLIYRKKYLLGNQIRPFNNADARNLRRWRARAGVFTAVQLKSVSHVACKC